MAFKYNKATKIYANDPKNPGKRIPVGQKQYGYGKVRYISYGKLEKKKPTMQDFFRAFARDSGLLKNKIKKFADAVKETGGGLMSTGDVVVKLDEGNKNLIEAKAIALDAKRLPSVDAPNTRNTGALKYTPTQKDYKITSASANKKRTSGNRIKRDLSAATGSVPSALRTNAAYTGGKIITPRMSNIVELENFVQKNMAAATKPKRSTNIMSERTPEFVPIATAPKTNTSNKNTGPARTDKRIQDYVNIENAKKLIGSVKIEKGAAPKADNTKPIIYEERDLLRSSNSKKNTVPIFSLLLQRFRAGQDWKGNPR